MTAAEWFSLLVERAPALRNAGVVEISLEGVNVKLAPAPVAAAAPAAPRVEEEPHDPLDAIPGYTLDPEKP